jgi:hypothetical protein
MQGQVLHFCSAFFPKLYLPKATDENKTHKTPEKRGFLVTTKRPNQCNPQEYMMMMMMMMGLGF